MENNLNHDKRRILIIGGGVMGCAVAYNLIRYDKNLDITVIEKDSTYQYASTSLSLANVRVQFTLPANIEISRYGMRVFDSFEEEMAVNGEKPDIAYKKEGNLFLVGHAGQTAAEQALEKQIAMGCQVKWWSTGEINSRYPLYNPDGLVGGTFGQTDGHLDAYGLLMGYRNKARSLGVCFIEAEVTCFNRDRLGITGVTLTSRESLQARTVINCAGAWAAMLARTIDIQLPIQSVKRQVFVLDTAIKPRGVLPLTVLPSGLYFRSDTGGRILLGKSQADDAVGFDFTWDWQRFQDTLWPELVQLVPAFDQLKLERGWAGLYAQNRFDGNAILGQWPDCNGFYLANGFSGHGFQQAPAVGRYLAELILEKEQAMDLSIFKPDRILEKKPLNENGLV